MLCVIAISCLAAIVTVRTSSGWDYFIDDSYITFLYPRNLIDGYGFIYNAGEKVLGASCHAWGIILSLFSIAHVDIPIAAHLLSFLFTNSEAISSIIPPSFWLVTINNHRIG